MRKLAHLESSKAMLWTQGAGFPRHCSQFNHCAMLPYQTPTGRTHTIPALKYFPPSHGLDPLDQGESNLFEKKKILNIWINSLKENKKCENK